jgi:hypothetical protein
VGKRSAKGSKVKYAHVEGVDGNGFVVYPEYKCGGGHCKSALDSEAMEKMGIPIFILRSMCPVVKLHNSTLTRGLYEMVLTMMPTIIGAAKLATLISSFRTLRWTQEGASYMELLTLQARPPRGSFVFQQKSSSSTVSTRSWPLPDSHCNGGLGFL